MQYRVKIIALDGRNHWDTKKDEEGYFYTYLMCEQFNDINWAYREMESCNKRNNGCLYYVESYEK